MQPSKWHGARGEGAVLRSRPELGSLGAWVRLHYVYPYPHVDRGRRTHGARGGAAVSRHSLPARRAAHPQGDAAAGQWRKTLERIARWRDICPELAMRSTFIVGFPGETERLRAVAGEWLKEARIDRAGCFKYEAVGGARANDIAAPVPEAVKEERWHRFMATQNEISAEIMAARVGRETEVLIDAIDHEAGRGGGARGVGCARDRRQCVPPGRDGAQAGGSGEGADR
jgi:ribosomal protein S12 methylthiotransferase